MIGCVAIESRHGHERIVSFLVADKEIEDCADLVAFVEKMRAEAIAIALRTLPGVPRGALDAELMNDTRCSPTYSATNYFVSVKPRRKPNRLLALLRAADVYRQAPEAAEAISAQKTRLITLEDA